MSLSSTISLRVTPKASRPGIGAWRTMVDGREVLEVRVRAPPEGGKANKEVIDLLAKTLGVPKGEVEIVNGTASRLKRVSVPLSEGEVRTRLS